MRYKINPDGTVTQVTPSNTEYTQRLKEKYETSLETELEYNDTLDYDLHKFY
jgi:hypothetical protein